MLKVYMNVLLILWLSLPGDNEDETSEDSDEDEEEGGKKGGGQVDEALAAEVTQLAEKRKSFLITKVITHAHTPCSG